MCSYHNIFNYTCFKYKFNEKRNTKVKSKTPLIPKFDTVY
jgi:hypothetical protein